MLDIRRLIKNGLCRKLPAGQPVTFLSDGTSPLREMYVLVAGKVDVYSEEPGLIPVGSLLPGDVFGGGKFFDSGDGHTYIAETDSIAFIISEQSFYSLAKAQPDILLEVLRAAYAPFREYIKKTTTAPVGEAVAPDGGDRREEPPSPAAQGTVNPGIFPEGHMGYPGITKPEYADKTFKKNYSCPYCNKQFAGRKISQSKLYETRSARYDLRKYYRDFQPEWYEIVTCPHCCFSMYYSYYLEQKRLDKPKIDGALAAAKDAALLNFDTERDIDFVFAAHYLALACAPGYMSSYWQICAKIWGNLSWLYEDVGDEDMMRLAAEKAAEAYEKVYTESYLTPVKEQVSCLSIAGMLYRAGKPGDGNLRKYLYRVKTISSGNKVYVALADDLTDMLRDNATDAK